MSESETISNSGLSVSTRPKRKLTTVLATDCVNFSYHMQLDKEATYRNLKQCRTLIDNSIAENAGRIFHTAGDSVIAEFNSPIEAINAAVECQKALARRNNDDTTELGLE
jgi:adenylate cyclase